MCEQCALEILTVVGLLSVVWVTIPGVLAVINQGQN